MTAFDSQVPSSFVRNYLEGNPSYRQGVNQETDALFNPSISARPLHIPQAGQIRKRLNTEMEYYWAYDRCGQNPNHTRIEQLRAVGFDYATTNDVDMACEEVVKGRTKEKFSDEIRNGDLRLMKVPRMRWLEIRKSHLLQAINMSNPRGKVMGENGTVMGAAELIPGVRTSVVDADEMRARAVVSNAAQDLADGQIRGNASVIARDSVNKGR